MSVGYHGLDAALRTGLSYSLSVYPDSPMATLFKGPKAAIGGTGVSISLAKELVK